MKAMFLLATALSLAAAISLRAEVPRGEVVEFHSCEVHTGGCTASAQATLEGRWMLRAWKFDAGTVDGIGLAGLSVALLEAADVNLAMEDTVSDRAVIYVPVSASEEQRKALAGFARGNALTREIAAVRPVALEVRRSDGGIQLSAGEVASLRTRPMESCDTGGCGESLWYSPRSRTNGFDVVMNDGAAVAEPVLQLKWRSNGTRSVFTGTFGEGGAEVAHMQHAH